MEGESAPSGGMGLAGMSERAFAMGGGLTVEAAVGRGTKINVTLPMPG